MPVQVGFQVSMCGWSAGPPDQGVLIPVTLGAVAVKANLPGSGVQSLMMDVDTLAEIVTRYRARLPPNHCGMEWTRALPEVSRRVSMLRLVWLLPPAGISLDGTTNA